MNKYHTYKYSSCTDQIMVKTTDLNQKVNSKERKKVFIKDDVQLAFDPNTIVKLLATKIINSHYVVGCIAWLTNKKILTALSTIRGVHIIVTRDLKTLRAAKSKYMTLPKYNGTSISVMGAGKGYKKSLMHHKFMVGLDARHEPLWVCTGSFNATESAKTNIENMILLANKDIAHEYLKEFHRIKDLAVTLKL
jgi:phosphatidylserine/phosphatidylglycerophosphate/cardiolipin synthase-like enzyme